MTSIFGPDVEPQHMVPAPTGGAGAAGGEVFSGGEIDPVPGLDRGAGQPDREHGLAHPGGPMNSTLAASSRNPTDARSRIRVSSTPGLAA